MTATLADAAVCLLLVSAAALVVADVDRPDPDSDRSVARLTTVTERVTYAVTPNRTLTRHGTLAELVAVAAVADGLDDHPPVRAVRRVARPALGRGVRVTARWRPTPTAPVVGCVTVGPQPPADGVRAASLETPVGSAVERDASVARRLLQATLPPERRRLARAGHPAAVRDRIRTLAAAYGVDGSNPSVAAAIDRLRDAIERRTEPGARDPHPAWVQITVRWWEP